MANAVSAHRFRPLAYFLLMTVILLGTGCPSFMDYDATPQGTAPEHKVVVRCNLHCGVLRNHKTGEVRNLGYAERSFFSFYPVIKTLSLDPGLYDLEVLYWAPTSPTDYFEYFPLNGVVFEAGHTYKVHWRQKWIHNFFERDEISTCGWIEDTTTGTFPQRQNTSDISIISSKYQREKVDQEQVLEHCLTLPPDSGLGSDLGYDD